MHTTNSTSNVNKMAHICCAELISYVGSQQNTMFVKDSMLRTTKSPSRYLDATRVEVSNHYFGNNPNTCFFILMCFLKKNLSNVSYKHIQYQKQKAGEKKKEDINLNKYKQVTHGFTNMQFHAQEKKQIQPVLKIESAFFD